MNTSRHNQFLGVPFGCNGIPGSRANFIKLRKKSFQKCKCAKSNDWISQGISFTNMCGRNVQLLWSNLGLRIRNGSMINSVKVPFAQTKTLVKSIVPLWGESLFFVRCSVFCAVISGICLVVWYGQLKAKHYVETKLLPSVCEMLSEHIQRDLDFGKVRRVSPLSITLESCSIGPHSEEFSCGEAPTVKLRILPLASLRRGRIVIDAILYNPSLLVAQKKDYSWLGIPYSEGSLMRHLSTEEGIDYRTKKRRIAREEAGARWSKERDDLAKESAEEGYTISEGNSSDWLRETASPPMRQSTSALFYSMDEKVQWRDHHCMDAGVEYDSKHADLERSFGEKVPPPRDNVWSTVTPGFVRGKFKRKANSRDLSGEDAAAKRRILELSASAAHKYFQELHENSLITSRSCGLNVEAVSVTSQGDVSVSNLSSAVPKANVGVHGGEGNLGDNDGKCSTVENITAESNLKVEQDSKDLSKYVKLPSEEDRLGKASNSSINGITGTNEFIKHDKKHKWENTGSIGSYMNSRSEAIRLEEQVQDPQESAFENQDLDTTSDSNCIELSQSSSQHQGVGSLPSSLKSEVSSSHRNISELWSSFMNKPVQTPKDCSPGAENIVTELVEGIDEQPMGIEKLSPVVLDSVYFKGGSLMLLAYGDREPREMENAVGYVKFQNHYGRIHVQLAGSCKMWRSGKTTEDGGWLSTDVYVDVPEQNWHVNLKVVNLYVPIFERILEIPITWSDGRASGEVHICMSRGEVFPNLHGQLDVTGLTFQIYDAPSMFHNICASLCFRARRIFLYNTSGWFGDVPLEASGDFGIDPEGEFHLMCQVPSVEVNALMKTFKMKPLLFSLAGSVTAVFNCQGPLDAPRFVGSALVSRKTANVATESPLSAAYEEMIKSKEAGAVAAIDRIPFSYVSANFTFNTDNCVADLYGIRATLVDGGEIRGAGNAWICPEGEVDDSATDVNFSGNLSFDKILQRYAPGYLQMIPFQLKDLTGETKLSGSLLRPRFDIKWTAPKAEGSLIDARGDIIISHDFITVNSSSAAFELYTKVLTSYPDEYFLGQRDFDVKAGVPFTVNGVELDLKMRGFEFFNVISSYGFDSLKPVHLKATGRIKFLGKVIPASGIGDEQVLASTKHLEHMAMEVKDEISKLVGDVSISGLKLNQLMLAPQLTGVMSIMHNGVKVEASGRADESLAIELIGPLQPFPEENASNQILSVSLQKGHLKAHACYRPFHSAQLEVRNLPLDELELASLRGTVQKAELQLNLQKRRGHGLLSVLHPKFSGVLGEALDVAARWSGDVIIVEKTILEQSNSKYELRAEYVLPGSRERKPVGQERGSLFRKAMTGHLGSVISSMGRWRVRLEVPKAEISEMLPLARLLSRNTDPAVQSRSKDLFIRSLQSVGINAESLQKLLEEIRGHSTPDEVVLEDYSLPGLAELRGRWCGSLDARGGGNGDTTADFDFKGEEWEWGTYKTQRVQAAGAYSNDDGLRLEEIFIQRDNATIHADGTLLGPITNLHFAVLNFPVSLVPTVVQVIETSATEAVHSLRQFLAPIRGILHMEGDLRGNLAKPECDVQVRLLDGAIGGIDLGRAELVASLTSSSRFLFNAKFEPIVQNGHVHIQGSIPITFHQNSISEEDNLDREKNEAPWIRSWGSANIIVPPDETGDKKGPRERNEEGWSSQLAESLKGLNWNFLDAGEVRVDADIKDGGMMLLTALSPYANWLHGNADVMLQVRGTVEQPVLDGSAYFHRATMSSPVLWKPITNFGGTVLVDSNRLSISSLEGRVSRKGKLSIKGNLPLRTTEVSLGDKINLKCEVLEVRAKNILSGQVDTQLQISGSVLQPNISGNIKLSHGEAYLPHDKGNGTGPLNRATSNQSNALGSYNRVVASKYVSRFLNLKPAASSISFPQPSGEEAEMEKGSVQVRSKPKLDIYLTDLKLLLGPELRIVYPLILNFAVRGELELNGIAHPKLIRPKGILTFENGDVNLVATQVRLKRDHLNIAKFEPDNGLDPMLDLALVGSEWQFRVQSRASNWQDKLVVTSTRSVEQDVLSPMEAARVFESQLAESILEGDGQLAFKKLATATLETLMPRIEGKGEFGHARWRLVYAPQIPSLLSVDPTVDPLKSLASNISFGTEVEVQLGKRLQASVVRQMKDSEMAMQWTLIYQLTSRLRVLLQSAPSKRLLFEYSTTSQD